MFKDDLTIQEMMKKEKLNVSEIAQKTGLSVAYISKLKNNKILATEQAQEKIYKAFGYYVKNELITAKNEVAKMQYELYQKGLYIIKLEKENARLKNAIKKCYEVMKDER